jgi:hypothetical protein
VLEEFSKYFTPSIELQNSPKISYVQEHPWLSSALLKSFRTDGQLPENIGIYRSYGLPEELIDSPSFDQYCAQLYSVLGNNE